MLQERDAELAALLQQFSDGQNKAAGLPTTEQSSTEQSSIEQSAALVARQRKQEVASMDR